MNVRTKLLVSQTLHAGLVIGFAAIAVVVAQRFDYQLGRVELAYDQRQTITMLAVQAFHYKTVIDKFMTEPSASDRELLESRRDVTATLQQLSDQTEQELSYVDEEERAREAEEAARVGQLRTGLAEISHMIDRIARLRADGRSAEVPQLRQQIDHLFADQIAQILARAMADEEAEVHEVDAEITDIASGRIAFLYGTGFCALLLSLITGLALYHTVSGPLKQLLAGVGALRGGDLKYRVPGGGSDEFAQLTRRFNEMAENLEDREQRLLGIHSDLENQVRQRTSDLEAANRRLSYLDRRRLQFLADVSHELRTPVTILRGEAEVTLRMKAGSENACREALGRIVQQAKQLGRLIDDLLFLVRSESDTVAFERQRVDLRAIVADAVRDGSTLAKGKQISVTDRLPAYPIWVEADAQRLRQAALIVIDNAINYSNPGSSVEVMLDAVDGRAVVGVLDHGIGIPAEELPYVFERFYRVRGRTDEEPAGSGLGLSIAKWIAEKHGGSVSMTSTPGEQTELRIELPLQDRSER